MTARVPLLDSAWTDLGPAPCSLRQVFDRPSARVLYVLAAATPTDLGAGFELPELGKDVVAEVAGQRVYARAQNFVGATVSVSSTSPILYPLAVDTRGGAVAGTAFSFPVRARSGGSGIAATASDGTVLTFANGYLSGTFTTAGDKTISIVETLAGYAGSPKTTTVPLTVAAPAPSLKPTTLTVLQATAGTAFSSAVGGRTSGSAVKATSSDGTVLTYASGAISGTFTKVGTPTITLIETLAGAAGSPRRTDIVIEVKAAAVTLGATSLASTVIKPDRPFTTQINGKTRGSTVSAKLADGTPVSVNKRTLSAILKSGVSIIVTETLVGAANSPRNTTIALTVDPALDVTPLAITGVPGAAVSGQVFSFKPTVVGGTAPYAFSYSAVAGQNGRPSGWDFLTSSGIVTGTTAQTGTFTWRVTVTDANGVSVYLDVSVVIAAGPTAVYSRADKYFFSTTGAKRSNRAGPLTNDASGAQSIYCGTYVQLANGPWAVPANTDLLAGFNNHWGVEASLTNNEQQVPVDLILNSVAIFYTDAGGVARSAIARKTNGKVGVLSATANDGGVVAQFPIVYPIPPEAPILFGIAMEGAAGAQIPAWARPIATRGEGCRQSATNNFVSVIESKGEIRSPANSNGISFGGSIPAPNWLASMGADGRPVLLIDSDSLAYGKGTPDSVAPLSRASGIVETAAKSLLNGGYEIPTCSLAIAGTGILNTHPQAAEYTPTAQRHGRALVDQVVALNGGVLPWSHYYCGHGNNGERSTLPLQIEYKKARFAWLKAWHDLPIIDQTCIPKATSTDGFRTLGNQTATGSWPARVGYRDKLAADKLDGTVFAFIDTWTPLVEASSGANGGRFKVRPFQAKTTRAMGAQASSGFADFYLDAAPTPGMALTYLDQSDPRDPAKDVVVIVTNVVDVSANGVPEYQVSVTTGGDSAAKPAQVVGSVIAECPTTDALPSANGVHISHLMNQVVSNYDGPNSWKALKDALLAASSVKWLQPQVATRVANIGTNYQRIECGANEFVDVVVGAGPRTGAIELVGNGGSATLRAGDLGGYIVNVSGEFDTLTITGIKSDATGKPAIDIIGINATLIKTLIVDNCRLVGVTGRSETVHGDCLQIRDMASVKSLIVRNSTLGSAFQAIIAKYLASGIGCPSVKLENVNVFNEVAIRSATGQTNSVAVIFVGQNAAPMKVVIINCYMDWILGYEVSFQGNVEVTGAFIAGRPPGGDFCP